MSIYTYTNEEFQEIHKKLCEAFNADIPYVDFGITTIHSVPRNSAPVSLPGELNPFYGKTHSPELKQKLSELRKNKCYEEIYGIDKATEIRKHQSESRIGSGNSFYGRKHSLESIAKINESVKQRDSDYYNRIGKILANRPKLSCPHCGKEVDERNAKRWHFDKCKLSQ